uniref:NGF domain-containing protein n=1 Tax=Meloidogyne floridensis TaxID=298350 RepID=A0A915P789_9BILA
MLQLRKQQKSLKFPYKEKEEINEGKHFKNDLEQHSFANKQKRTSIISEHLSEHEHVYKDNNPVEIQQDERRQFIATFIECANSKGDQCHGIDDLIYSSKCVTVYELRPAGIRMEGDVGDFVDGVIRVPITCQCQLYRRLFVGNTD